MAVWGLPAGRASTAPYRVVQVPLAVSAAAGLLIVASTGGWAARGRA